MGCFGKNVTENHKKKLLHPCNIEQVFLYRSCIGPKLWGEMILPREFIFELELNFTPLPC